MVIISLIGGKGEQKILAWVDERRTRNPGSTVALLSCGESQKEYPSAWTFEIHLVYFRLDDLRQLL